VCAACGPRGPALAEEVAQEDLTMTTRGTLLLLTLVISTTACTTSGEDLTEQGVISIVCRMVDDAKADGTRGTRFSWLGEMPVSRAADPATWAFEQDASEPTLYGLDFVNDDKAELHGVRILVSGIAPTLSVLPAANDRDLSSPVLVGISEEVRATALLFSGHTNKPLPVIPAKCKTEQCPAVAYAPDANYRGLADDGKIGISDIAPEDQRYRVFFFSAGGADTALVSQTCTQGCAR
jgi:hypothetical protein